MFTDIPASFTERVLCSIDEPALIYDENMTICWANPAAEIHFGHSAEVIHGKKCRQLFHSRLVCMGRCPVERALQTGMEQLLAVNTIRNPHKLIEAIPCLSGDNNFVLAIIHSVPEAAGRTGIRRDLAAALNTSATLPEAADTILDAMAGLAFVHRRGIYALADMGYRLIKGIGTPVLIPRLDLPDQPGMVYIPPEDVSFHENDPFTDGCAVVPVQSASGEVRIILLAGRGSWGMESRSMLELLGEVLAECVERLTTPFSNHDQGPDAPGPF